MPVHKVSRLHKVYPSPVGEKLKERLIQEWSGRPNADPHPEIIEEQGKANQPLHVYVIWDDWQGLDQIERSEIIMDAFEACYGAAKMLNVTVAMGLTRAEAERMGIRAA